MESAEVRYRITLFGGLALAALALAIVGLVIAIAARKKADTSVQKYPAARISEFSPCASRTNGTCSSGLFTDLQPPQGSIQTFNVILAEESMCNYNLSTLSFEDSVIMRFYYPSQIACPGNVASISYLNAYGASRTMLIQPNRIQEMLMMQPAANQPYGDWAFPLGNYTSGIVSLTQFGSLSDA